MHMNWLELENGNNQIDEKVQARSEFALFSGLSKNEFCFFKLWVIPYSPPLINKSFFFSCWVSNHFVKMIFQSSHPKRPVYQVQSSSQKRKPDAPYYSEKVFVCISLTLERKLIWQDTKKNCSYCKKVVANIFTDVLLFTLRITYTYNNLL